MKRKPRPVTLRPLWVRVRALSCADGTIRIEPTWRKEMKRPGVLTRLAAAQRVQNLINAYLKKRVLP